MRSTLLILFVLILTGCGTITIQQNERLAISESETQKIICISPRFYFNEDELNYDLKKFERLNKVLKTDIERYAKKNKLNVELRDFDEQTNPEFYHELVLLKNNMLAENFNQQTPLNFSRSGKSNSIQKSVLVYPPRISHEFSTYSQKFGTPYFSYIGIYAGKGTLVLYHVMVDTDKCETVYREVKTVKSKVNTNTMAQMIFDSYAMLKKQLK